MSIRHWSISKRVMVCGYRGRDRAANTTWRRVERQGQGCLHNMGKGTAAGTGLPHSMEKGTEAGTGLPT